MPLSSRSSAGKGEALPGEFRAKSSTTPWLSAQIWAENIAANPLVRLRIAGTLYDLRAERVTDAVEIASFGKVWARQSMFLRDPAQFEEVWLYRMAPR